jgi:hypothetical protein
MFVVLDEVKASLHAYVRAYPVNTHSHNMERDRIEMSVHQRRGRRQDANQ